MIVVGYLYGGLLVLAGTLIARDASPPEGYLYASDHAFGWKLALLGAAVMALADLNCALRRWNRRVIMRRR